MKVISFKRMVWLPAISLLLGTAACSGTYKHTIEFNPTEPLRVAVLPFSAVDESGKPLEVEGRLLIDNLSLVSSDQADTPVQIVRRQVLSELAKTDLDLVSSALIDIDLPHHGFNLPDGKVDTQKLWRTDPKDLCSKFLNCDAVLYGRLRRWNRSYYGVQSVSRVEIELRLVSAKTGKLLFQTTGEDSDSRGLTKGPTGFSSIIIEPVRGLDSQILVDLSAATVKKMLQPLHSEKRPEFLDTAPPSIYAASHDEPASGEPLVVVLYGSPDSRAEFSAGAPARAVPMIETVPGHYYGELLPRPGETIAAEPMTVRLTDRYGRVTSQRVGQGGAVVASN